MSDSSQPKNSYHGFEAKDIETLIKECTIDLSGTGANMSDVSYSYNSPTYSYTDSGSTITLSQGVTGAAGAGTYTISTLSSSDTITLTGLDASSFTFQLPEEWKDSFPAWGRVEDMCEKYPGLKIAFENFKVVYEMVKDDYDNPVPKK